MDKPEYDALVKRLYFPPAKQPQILTVSPMRYVMIDGQGDPNTSEAFQDAVAALYSVSYGIKMLPKKGTAPPGYFEYKVSALEGLWTMPEGEDFDPNDKSRLIWTLIIMQPPFVTPELFEEVRIAQRDKKKLAALDSVRFETLDEGLCAQALHIGPFDTEPETFEKLHAFLEQEGYERIELGHHEIYMSDFRKTAPEKLKTVLRVRIREKR
ncbi:MAG: GyrI-like domain-containing protein [Christensenellales bacterium]|jgi:hypothetical protein